MKLAGNEESASEHNRSGTSCFHGQNVMISIELEECSDDCNWSTHLSRELGAGGSQYGGS